MRRLLEIAVGLGLAWAAGRAASAAAPPAAAEAAPPPAPVEPAASPPALGVPRIGPAYDSDAALPARADPVASYTLRASLDPQQHTLHGEGRITWRNASRIPQSEVYLHLYLNGFKNDRSLFLRVPLDGFRGLGTLSKYGWIAVKRLSVSEMDGVDLWPGADHTSPGDPDDETDLRVPLPRPVAPGETIHFDVAWDEQLPELVFRTGFSDGFHFVGQWFPKLARLEPDGRWTHFAFHHLSEFYADFGTYDVTVDTPESMIVGATGELAGEVRAGGRVERRYLQQNIHDFAFTAWDAFRERTSTSTDGKVAIRCLYPQGYDRAAEVEIDTARYGLDYLGAAFGRYPYATLTLVHPPTAASEAGGMEYPTLITTGGAWWFPYAQIRPIDIVTIHELGHQWFYGLVATDEHAWPFLDEGVNSYAEADSMEARYPGASIGDPLGLRVSLLATDRLGSADRVGNARVAQPAPAFQSGGDYGALVYGRTATILLTLGRVYGEDLVRRAVGRYARRYRFEHPGPEALIGAIDEVVGPDAATALRAALFDRATVDYAAGGVVSAPAAAPSGIFGDPAKPAAAPPAPAGAFQGSVLVRRRGALRFPVDVDLFGEDGAVQRVRWEARSDAERLPWVGASRLVAVVIDPEHRVLLDDNLTNNARRLEPSSLGGPTLDRALFLAQAALTAVLP